MPDAAGRPAQPPEVRSATRSAVHSAVHPAVVILAVAGLASIISDTRVWDGSVLVVASVVLTWDGARRPAPEPSSPPAALSPLRSLPARTPRVVGALLCAVLALVLGLFDRYSWPVTVPVWALAAVVTVVCWPSPRRPAGPASRDHEPGPTRSARAWAGLGIVAATWELGALLGQPTLTTGSSDSPTISVLLDPVLVTYPGRTLLIAVWLAAGWRLCRRVAR